MEQNVRFSVAPLISDHAVLQRDEVIPVRGRGRAGARVRAELEPEWVVTVSYTHLTLPTIA